MCLQTLVHDYSFLHIIYASAFDYTSAYKAFQRSVEADLTPCDTDNGCYHNTFESGFVHDVSTDLLEMHKQDTSGNLITGSTLPWHAVSWIVPRECRVTFNEATALMQFDGDDRVNDRPPPTDDVKYPLAVDFNAHEDRDLCYILPSDAIVIQSGWRGDFSAIQQKCRLYG